MGNAGETIHAHHEERLCPFMEMERFMERDPFKDPFFEDAFTRRSETTGENEEVSQVQHPKSEQKEEQKEEAGEWNPHHRVYSYKSNNKKALISKSDFYINNQKRKLKFLRL